MYRKRGELKVLGQSYSFPSMVSHVHKSLTNAFWLKVKKVSVFAFSLLKPDSLKVSCGFRWLYQLAAHVKNTF